MESKRKERSTDEAGPLARAVPKDPDQYAYQDDIAQEDPVKERKLLHVVEFKVGSVATPAEMEAGSGESGKAKGQAVFFIPPTAGGLGTFIGMKSAAMTFHNDTDQKLVVNGAWTKNWSLQQEVVDTIEPFSLEIQPRSKKTTECKHQWNFPFCPADGQTVPARLLLMRYYVHGSDAWSEKYKATDLTVTEGVPLLTEKMKDVTAYRRTLSMSYHTIGGVIDDETPTELIGFGKFQNFSDIGAIDGTEPMPPMPSVNELKGRSGKIKRRFTTFGMSANPVTDKASNPTYQDVVVNLSGTDKIGLGVYPVDYYDEVYGWGGVLMLVSVSKKEMDEDTMPAPWLNTYTTPDVSNNSTLEWELPALGTLTLDETNDDNAIVAGRYKFAEEFGGFVLWDYGRGKPVLVGSGYGSFQGGYQFYGPKVFTGKKTVIKAVMPGAFRADKLSTRGITWLGVFTVVCKVIEVLYLLGKTLGIYGERDAAMERMTNPIGYMKKQAAKEAEARLRLVRLKDRQKKAFAGKTGTRKKPARKAC